jgi:hypothetical protein
MVKKVIRNVIGSMILASAIVFSIMQLNTSVVRADGCPDAGTVGCGCVFMYSTSGTHNGQAVLWCRYMCGFGCGGGGGDPILIEQEIMVYQ